MTKTATSYIEMRKALRDAKRELEENEKRIERRQHEMAHQMDSYLTKLLRADDINEHRTNRKNISEVILDEVCANLGMDRYDAKASVSKYAQKKSDVDAYDDRSLETTGFYNGDDLEIFAEAISEYIGSPTPRPVAVETWNVLQKYLKQAEERSKK